MLTNRKMMVRGMTKKSRLDTITKKELVLGVLSIIKEDINTRRIPLKLATTLIQQEFVLLIKKYGTVGLTVADECWVLQQLAHSGLIITEVSKAKQKFPPPSGPHIPDDQTGGMPWP